LPGNDELYRPVTLDMNGQIVIRARGEEQLQPTPVLGIPIFQNHCLPAPKDRLRMTGLSAF
jgi:hypothetical protein